MAYDWDGARSRRIRLVKIGAAILAIGLLAVVADKALAYSGKDAGFVTPSKNAAVLDYVVCLHDQVGKTPKSMSILQSLDAAEKACRSKARKLPHSAKEPGADEIKLMIMECGFQPGDASPDVDCG